MLKLTIILLLFFPCFSINAQVNISGNVTDSKDGSPLSGASIQVRNSKIFSLTKNDGSFSLNGPTKGIIIISNVGYQTTQLPITSFMSIKLSKVDNSLSEVIVTGYGSKIKRDLTGSVARVGASELANTPVTSFEPIFCSRIIR